MTLRAGLSMMNVDLPSGVWPVTTLRTVQIMGVSSFAAMGSRLAGLSLRARGGPVYAGAPAL